MKSIVWKADCMDIVRSVVFSLAIAALLVLLGAVIMKFTDIPDAAIMPINIAIKIISVLAGASLGIKSKTNGALKGLVIGLFTLLFTYLIYSGINGSFSKSGITYIDAIILVAVAIVSGIIAVNIKGRKRD